MSSGLQSPAPYARRARSVPVTVVTDKAALARYGGRDTAVVRLDAQLHAHEPGTECIACDSRGNVRVLLFELQEKLSRGMVEPFVRVVVDATDAADPAAVADALVPGRLPAFGLRDHAVARNFHLEAVI
jgi:G3E family GTPase